MYKWMKEYYTAFGKDFPFSKVADLNEYEIIRIIQYCICLLYTSVLTGKLLQFASGAIYDEGRNIINIHDYKLDALEEIQVDNIGKNLMVIYWYQHDKDKILKRFPKARVLQNIQAVSYTHLDVYKRQVYDQMIRLYIALNVVHVLQKLRKKMILALWLTGSIPRSA